MAPYVARDATLATIYLGSTMTARFSKYVHKLHFFINDLCNLMYNVSIESLAIQSIDYLSNALLELYACLNTTTLL